MANKNSINDLVISNLYSNLPGMFFRCKNDAQRTMILVSEGCEKLTGYTSDELTKNKLVSYPTLIYLEDKKILLEKIKQALLNNEPCNNEYRIIDKTGNTKWVREIANGIYDQTGKLLYTEGFIQDFSSEKSASLLTNIFSSYQNAINASSIMSMVDGKGKIIFANELFCYYSKYTRDELVGKDHRIVNSGYHTKEFFKDLWKTIGAGKIWRGEIKNKAKDGSYYWVDTVISPVFNEKREIVQFFSIRNIIADKKETEERLQKSEYLLSEAQQIAKIGSWEVDIASGEVFWSDEMYKICDCDAKTFLPTKDSFEDLIHPDDKKLLSIFIKGMMAGVEQQSIEFRINTLAKKEKYIRAGSNTIKDPLKKAIKIIGTAQDITDQKKSENELITHKLFTDTILNNLPIDIAVFDRQHKYVFANKKAISDDATRNWIVGKDDFEYCEYKGIDSSLAKKRRKAFNEVIASGIGAEWVDQHTLAGGEVKYLLRKLYPYFKNKELEYVFGYGVDITELLIAEQKTKESEERYRTLFETMSEGVMITNSSSKIKLINVSFSNMLGYDSGELIDLDTSILFESNERRDELREKIKQQGKNNSLDKFEIEFKTKLGNKIVALTNSFPYYDIDGKYLGIMTICTDITEDRKKDAEYKKLAELNRKIIDSSDNVFYVITVLNSNQIFNPLIYVSGKVSELMGVKADYLIAHTKEVWINAVHPDDLSLFLRNTQKIYIEKKAQTQIYRIKKFNTTNYIWLYHFSAPIFDSKGEITEIYGSVRNITELKNKEIELEKINNELVLIEENERKKIAYDLHDSLLQILAGSKMFLKTAKSKGDFLELEASINMAISEVRNILNNLSPTMLYEHGLFKGIELLTDQISKSKSLTIDFTYLPQLTTIKLEEQTQFNLFRIIQESIANTLKYGLATEAKISINQHESNLEIVFSTNGANIKEDTIQNTNNFASIRRRINILNGTFEIKKNEEKNTVFCYTIPIV